MYARQLERILADSTLKIGLGRQSHAEMADRFRRLRGFGLLPKVRAGGRRHLSSKELASALLSLPGTPGYAGLTAKLLMNLRPVGGAAASFLQSPTLGDAVANLFEDEEALRTFVELRLSEVELFSNASGHASITFYRDQEEPCIAYFVPPTAHTLISPGAEVSYTPRTKNTAVFAEYVIHQKLLELITNDFDLRASLISPILMRLTRRTMTNGRKKKGGQN